ncbi:5'-methylthioadenosine/S-adenosylhomocysteine nucleosidase [Acuticoccus sp. MNP-M23]|uniref:5'-methylthioadenosine/S-adenosylhomocysteine nucleosidase n=1 Tax=Acuticoccus sp. MNP-M23 TaxID=3072793 RepID=UPI00281620D3|nr:5'-methylthioadenosine/S-adenosylhomocysteine nucleosidase [Acuticoccus sp. MNP-M23]WMS41445.1 5'-methylthioadenosine/S-adenosylhomocysteine nucleosidase [Acuticoccus sp. MNP-M23]
MKRTILAAGIVAMAGLAASAVTAEAQKLDETPRVALISAFEPEWGVHHEKLTGAATYERAGVRFVTGELGGRDVVLFLSGISMVNAAMTTQMAIDSFNIDTIVFSGIAGGVDPDLNIGDVVVAEKWGPYLDMVIARETDDGFKVPPFFGTPFPNYGMMFPQAMEVRSEGSDAPEPKFWFEADASLLATARKAVDKLDLEDCGVSGACLSAAPKVVVGGNGVSGSAFVDNEDFRQYVSDTFDAKVLDMESAAVAQVAYANGVPFIVFRSLSDLAGGSDAANEMQVFMGLAASNSAAVVEAFLKETAAN